MKIKPILVTTTLVSAAIFAMTYKPAKVKSGKEEVAPVPAGTPGMVVLKIDLPKPKFVGTPKPPITSIHVPNIEPLKPRGWKRPPFFVPEGTFNISVGKDVTSSDDMPLIGELEMIVDGDKRGSEMSAVELGPGKQWVQIDLGERCDIYAVMIWRRYNYENYTVYHDVVFQASDNENMKDAVAFFNNDHNNSSNLGFGNDMAYRESFKGKLINAKGARGRYVRMYSKGNYYSDFNYYTEVEVYGKPVENEMWIKKMAREKLDIPAVDQRRFVLQTLFPHLNDTRFRF